MCKLNKKPLQNNRKEKKGKKKIMLESKKEKGTLTCSN